MPEAHIVHDGYGFRCATLNLALPLTLGLDGSAVLHHPGALPEAWLTAALD
ncbi:acetyltransferase, partial [Cronobacter sakazakii]|nr:acetyltransferase [Cronobacter sakazakii]